MSHDNVNGKANGDLISRRKLDGMRLAVPDFVNPDQRTKGWNECITYIQQKAPAVDAVPVVHGRWIDSKGAIRCSECLNTPLYDYHGRLKLSKACPTCGVKMDLEG